MVSFNFHIFVRLWLFSNRETIKTSHSSRSEVEPSQNSSKERQWCEHWRFFVGNGPISLLA